tara:strand:+ start:7441 stop:8385 length:945 start_codon:yes stop_codon:yes gene_type:complete
MSAQGLGTKGIIGEYFRAMEQDVGVGWVNSISNHFGSDQLTETYEFLGQSPVFREWIGGRNAKGLLDFNFTITNKHYESTLEITERQRGRDKTSQVQIRINDQVRRASAHWASLLSTLITNGASTACYDAQFFFDTDHSEGASGSQSNDVDIDISELPAATAGVVTAPSSEEANLAVLKAISLMTAFVDDQGEPMNEEADEFLVMVPHSLFPAFQSGLTNPRGTGLSEQENTLTKISVVANARVNSSWDDEFAVFRTDSAIKPLIRQEEVAPRLKVRAEGSEFEFENDAHQFGLDAWRNVGYGYWQHAFLGTMT